MARGPLLLLFCTITKWQIPRFWSGWPGGSADVPMDEDAERKKKPCASLRELKQGVVQASEALLSSLLLT